MFTLGHSSTLRVVCFGDSITGPRPGMQYLDQYVKFSDLLGLMLEARLGAGPVVLNKGWAGETAVEARERVQSDVINEGAEIAIIQFGGNDMDRYGPNNPKTRESLTAIYSELQAAGIKVLALQYHLVINPDGPKMEWRHLKVSNDMIASIAESLDVPFLDMETPMNAAGLKQPLSELANPVDGVHLNPGGELVYARTIFAKLDQLGWVK